MTESLTKPRRSRAPLGADLAILVLGIWGFLRQCLKSWLRAEKGPDELESDR